MFGQESTPASQKILIVSSDDNVGVLRKYLSDAQYQVQMIFSGQGCFETVKLFQPNLVIVDHKVSGKSGLDIISRLLSDLRFNLMSAPKILYIAKMVGEIDMAFNVPVDDCVMRPFSNQQILRRVRQLLVEVELTLEFAQKVFKSSFEAVALFHKRDNTIVYANPRMLKLLEYDELPHVLTAPNITDDFEVRKKILEQINRNYGKSSRKLLVHVGIRKIPCYVRIESYNEDMFIMFAHETGGSHIRQEDYEGLINKFDAAMIIYGITNGEKHVIKVNDAAKDLLGYSSTEISDLSRDALVIEEKVTKDTFKVFLGSPIPVREATIRHKDGHSLDVSLTTHVTTLDTQEVIIDVFQNQTANKQLDNELQQSQHRNEALRQIMRSFMRLMSLDELLQMVTQHICEHLHATAVNCMMIEDQHAVVVNRETLTASFNVGTMRTEILDLNTTQTLKWMVEHKEALYIPDVESYEGWYSTSQEYWLKSYLGVPIIVNDGVIGFFGIDGSKVDQFSDEHIRYVEILVEQVGLLIQDGVVSQEAYEQNGMDSFISQPDKSISIEFDNQKYLGKYLTEQLNLFRKLLDHLPVHIYIKDQIGRYVLMNTALRDTIKDHFGLDSLVELTDEHLDWGDEFVNSNQIEREIFTSGHPIINDEITIKHPKTGEIRHYLTTKTPIYDDEGRVIYVVGIDREVTKLKRTLDHVVESVNCILWYADVFYQDGEYRWMFNLFSEAAAQRLLPVDVAEGSSYMEAWKDAIYDEDLTRINNVARFALENGDKEFDYEFRCVNKYGDTIWIREDARVTQLSATHWRVDYVAIDATERRKTLHELENLNEKLEARVKERTAALTQSNAQLNEEILERQRIENILREQEKQYRTLTNQLPLGVYRVTLDGQFLYANDQFAHMLGYDDVDKLIEQSINNFYVNPQDRQAIIQRAMAKPLKRHTDELNLIRRDGQRIWMRSTWRLMKSGDETYIDGIMEDITQTRLIQEAEKEQRRFVESLQNASTELSKSLNLDDVIKVVLKHLTFIMPKHQTGGVMLIEKVGEVRSIAYQRQTPDGPEVYPTNNTFKMRLLPNLVKMYENQQPLTVPNTDLDPNWRYVEVTSWIKSYIGSPIVVAGEVIGFINLSSDTPDTFREIHSQRLMAFSAQVGIAMQNARMYESIQHHARDLEMRVADRTRELEHKTFQLQTILNAMAEGVIYYNEDVQAQFTNQSMVEITGYSPYELKHDSLFADLLQLSEEDFKQWRNDLMDTLNVAKVWHGEYQLKRKDGSVFDAYIGVSRVQDEQERFLGFVMVIRDISQEKHLERQRINFITQASHQLRTPITNMKTYLYLIRRKPEDTEKHLAVIEEVTDHLHQLVESLLEITKSASVDEPLRRYTIPVQAPIIEVVESVSNRIAEKGLSIDKELPEEPIYVSIDPGQIKGAFVRILDNAIRATETGGKLHISAALSEEKDRILIKFEDTGVGIPDQLVEDVFTPFIRGLEDFSGIGMGLTIVKHIVTLNGGTIDIESVENEGTTVTVTLPIVTR